MLDPDFDTVLGLEFPNEARIPELACDSEVFTAPHEGVRLASFRRRRYARGVKVFLFAPCYRDQSNTVSLLQRGL